MRKPLFLEGIASLPAETLKIAEIDPARIRSVAWSASPIEPALPELQLQVPGPIDVAPPAPPDPRPVTAAPSFEPLHSEPAPRPGFPPWAEEKLRAAIEALRAQGERLAEQARSDALELGLLIARRIVERELSANLDSVFSLIKSAIRRAGEDHVTRVRLSPADAARFEQAGRADFSLGKITVESDPNLILGDVMVDTEHHSIDGRLHTRFEEITRQLDGMAP